jgi:hypothetical protein
MGDADDTYDFSALGPFVERLRGGSDLVMGNRFLGGIERGAMPVLHRYFGNPALSLLARLFFGTRCGDVYCGLRALRRDAYDAMALQSDGMEFALEMVVKSALLRMQVSEVPVALSSSPVDRTSHLKTWRDGRRSLRLYLLCAPQWLFLYPGIVLAVSGLIGGTLIALRVGRIHGVRFDVHSMLYCGFATIIGCQAIFFALFSRILGARAGLLPPDSALERGLARFRIEYALALAAVLLAAGLAGSLWAVEEWRRVSFGDLDPFEMLRLVIPSAVALALGCQTAFCGLYLSLLKHYRDAPREEGEPRAP